MVEPIFPHPICSSYEYSPSQEERDVLKMKLRSILTQKKELRAEIPTLLKAPIDGVVVIPKNERLWEILIFQEFHTSNKKLRMEGRFLKDFSIRHSIPLMGTFKIQDCE